MGNYLMVFVLTTVTIGISHQVSINIHDIVGTPLRSVVCVHFFTDSRSCRDKISDCNDQSSCVKIENENSHMLRFPDQNITNEILFKVYSYEITVELESSYACRQSSTSGCRYRNSSSYQVNGTTYSYQITLTDVLVTPSSSVPTSIHTTRLGTTASHPSISTRGTLNQTTVYGDQTTTNHTSLTSTSPVVSLTSTRGKASPQNTDTPSGNETLIGGIIGGVVVVIIVIIVIIFCWYSKRICRNSVVPDVEVCSEKEQLSLPEMIEPEVGTTADAIHANNKLPPLVVKWNEDNEAPPQGSSRATESQEKKKKKKKKKNKKQKGMDNEAPPQGSSLVTESEEKKKKKKKKKNKKGMEKPKQIQDEPDIEFDVKHEQANLLTSDEALAKKRSHEPSTEDIMTGNASAPIPNNNEWREGNPGATTPYIIYQTYIDSHEQLGSQDVVKMRDGRVKRKRHKEPDEGNESHIDLKELNDSM